ncbi:MAG: GntR family transcriptional regulator [Bacillota bacterium]|nr:GntR family transcriptional regulator [Bacillota bacterium]
MRFQIDPNSGIPIYVQLKEAIRRAIALGEYAPGDQLPTVRQLAVDLKINVNTVSKVYAELEREGLLATRQGRGTFVNNNPPPPADGGEQRLGELVNRLLVEAMQLGYTPEEVVNYLLRIVEKRD